MGGRKETRSVLDMLNFKYVLDIQVEVLSKQLISHQDFKERLRLKVNLQDSSTCRWY